MCFWWSSQVDICRLRHHSRDPSRHTGLRTTIEPDTGHSRALAALSRDVQDTITYNYVRPSNIRTEMYAGRVACCIQPGGSRWACAGALLRSEEKIGQTDGRTDGQTDARPLLHAYHYKRGQRKNYIFLPLHRTDDKSTKTNDITKAKKVSP